MGVGQLRGVQLATGKGREGVDGEGLTLTHSAWCVVTVRAGGAGG